MTTSTETAEDRMSGLSGRVRRLRSGASEGRLDRWLLATGAILMPIGIVLIVIGWIGASGTTLTYQQNDYLISGGILGLALVVAGGFTYFAYWQTVRIREGRTQAAAMTQAIGRLETLLSGGGATQTYVATANGTIYHRQDCSAVAGRDDISEVDLAVTSLAACRICTPPESA
jgi:hypothetical protein